MGAQKCRWNDLLHHDLVKCGLEQDSRELAQDWRELAQDWRGVVKTCVDTISKEAEQKEDKKKDKKRRTQHSHISLLPWLGSSVHVFYVAFCSVIHLHASSTVWNDQGSIT